MSFDTGYCRMAFDDNDVVQYIHSSATYAWTPVYVAGQGVLVPIADVAANVSGAYRKRGILNFIVASGVTITKGDQVYYNSTDGVIQGTAPAAGFLIGTAMQTGTGTSTGSVVVNVDLNTFGAPGSGLISVLGSTGAVKASYATVDLAVAALAAGDVLKLGTGSFTLGAGVDITKAVKIFGAGKKQTTIVAAAAADYAFKLVLGALTASTEVDIGDLTIDHGDDATQVGIQIDNLAATKKLIVNIDNVDFESDGGNSVDVDHSDTTAAVRVRISNSYLEGPVNMVVAHNEDQLYITDNSDAIGGVVTSAGAYTANILLEHSKVKTAGVTGGAVQQTLYAYSMLTHTDANPDVFATFVSGDAAGSHTESLISP